MSPCLTKTTHASPTTPAPFASTASIGWGRRRQRESTSITNTIIDRDATLARFTDEERERFEALLAEFEAQPVGADRALTAPYCKDEAQVERKAMCFALGLRGYTEGIWSIDPCLNPVAVEEMMRMQYGTLDALPHWKFLHEVGLARAMEGEEPGSLAGFDFTTVPGEHSPDFLQAEKLVQERRRVVVADRLPLPLFPGPSAAFPSL